MPVLEREDSQIYYEGHGAGYPVLLFAPGFLSSRIERWRTNPARPGVPQDWLDPTAELADRFWVVAMDVRNAGRSRGVVGPADGWHTYIDDALALLGHLGIAHCHVMGACIGVSFAFALAQAAPGLVSAMVLQNPIGLTAGNRAKLDEEFDGWVNEVRNLPGVDSRVLPALGKRLFGGDFIFSVSRDFVAACKIPMLLMPGDDVVHPAETSTEISRLAPHAEILSPWKGPQLRQAAMDRVRAFLVAHEGVRGPSPPEVGDER